MKKFIKNIKFRINQIENSYFKKCREKMTFRQLSVQCLKTSWLAFLLFISLVISLIINVIMICD